MRCVTPGKSCKSVPYRNLTSIPRANRVLLMIFRFCECFGKSIDGTKPGLGGLIICARCDGFIECDFCSAGRPAQLRMPIAAFIIGGRFVCSEHAWVGIAKKKEATQWE